MRLQFCPLNTETRPCLPACAYAHCIAKVLERTVGRGTLVAANVRLEVTFLIPHRQFGEVPTRLYTKHCPTGRSDPKNIRQPSEEREFRI
jgi:hypothetical protein